ncbi:MAG TPA: aminotransferase class I/II-fold pyridoxal phosphate-dependent enzyme [Polyangia bacterium]|jgi:dTDP-4-amino-4,6-dideoxygalactose transaminase
MSRIYLSPPHMGPDERALLIDAFDSNWIAPLGPHVDAFERELGALVEGKAAAALSSGTAGLHLALILLGVGAGDEVVVSDLTFAASANVVRYVGATPVFVDADRETWTMDPDLLAEALADGARRGRVPKAVIAVDLYGQSADYDRLRAVCAPYDVPIIQDASESLGATYRGRPAGVEGVMGVFSFNGNKILTTSGGGMLISNNAAWIAEARLLATQARDPAPHYQHSKIGYNYRLSNLLAAIGRGQLRVLPSRVAARRANFAWYHERLNGRAGWAFMPEASYGACTRWLTCVTIDPATASADRETVRLALAQDDIEARPLWKPMHLQPVFAGCRMFGGAVGRHLFETGLCLPSGSALTEAERLRVLAGIAGAASTGRAPS